jgi:hypothetical protein
MGLPSRAAEQQTNQDANSPCHADNRTVGACIGVVLERQCSLK